MSDQGGLTLPLLDNRISTGNLLTIATALAAAGLAWGTMRADLNASREHMLRIEQQTAARITQVEGMVQSATADRVTALQAQDARLRTIEAVSSRDGARLDAIMQSLARIEARLDRTEGR